MQSLSGAITVAQLNNWIKQIFEAEEMLHHIEVIGEISGFKITNGNAFFTLKDEHAEIKCTMWGAKENIKDGTKVIARGTVSYWNKKGQINFSVTKISEFGLGELMKLLQELQDKLRKEGLFDVKKSMPDVVKRVGVVTSKTGAVIHDIATVVMRRNPNVDIVLFPSLVQGVGAENDVIRGIEYFNKAKTVDVIIVARGGGSFEDLAPFNTEVLARAVFGSSIPIVSAVGHESDFTLVDFVSDLRAGTPSIAAELCVREVTTERDKIIHKWESLKSIIARKLDKQNEFRNQVKIFTNKTQTHFNNLESRLEVIATKIEERNPVTILRRGFAKPNKDLTKLKQGDDFEILYYNKDKIEKGVATWK